MGTGSAGNGRRAKGGAKGSGEWTGKTRTTHVHMQAVAMLYGKEAGQQGVEGNGTRNGKEKMAAKSKCGRKQEKESGDQRERWT